MVTIALNMECDIIIVHVTNLKLTTQTSPESFNINGNIEENFQTYKEENKETNQK